MTHRALPAGESLEREVVAKVVVVVVVVVLLLLLCPSWSTKHPPHSRGVHRRLAQHLAFQTWIPAHKKNFDQGLCLLLPFGPALEEEGEGGAGCAGLAEWSPFTGRKARTHEY